MRYWDLEIEIRRNGVTIGKETRCNVESAKKPMVGEQTRKGAITETITEVREVSACFETFKCADCHEDCTDCI